jgi:hypothetical protein
MASRNIISTPVEETKIASIGGVVKPISHQKTNYFLTGNNNYLPGSVDFQHGNFSPQTRVFFNQYDQRGNILEMQKASDVRQVFIWGYNMVYPIAKVTNAKSNEIFHDSYEEFGTWNGVVYDNTKAHTGRYSGRIDNTTTWEVYHHSSKSLNISLSATTKFKYSGWVWSSGPATQIYLFMRRAGQTVNYDFDYVATSQTGNWVYIEKEFDVPADVIELNLRIDNDGGGTVWFDDIRLHPAAAEMTTYTYDPLIGMTSETDISNRTQYYHYDGFSRLSLIKNENQNILKKYCYNYAGQEESCGPSLAALWQSTGIVQCVQVSGQNNGYQQRQEKDNNPISATYNQLRWVDNGYNVAACPVPPSCSISTCSAQGEAYSCINGQCEFGYAVYTSSFYNEASGLYECQYHYEYSDGSWSQPYYRSSSYSCL